MRDRDNNTEKANAANPKEQKDKQASGKVDLQEREQQARKQQEKNRLKEEPHSSDTKDALQEKTRQGLNNR